MRKLKDAKTVWGGQRFYPPGQHPATQRTRELIKKIAALPDSREKWQALGYADRKLREFEVGEDRAKRHYLGYS